jgi:hypothetical protein
MARQGQRGMRRWQTVVIVDPGLGRQIFQIDPDWRSGHTRHRLHLRIRHPASKRLNNEIGRLVQGMEQMRVSLATAMADGSDAPLDIDAKSWVGKRRSAHPYTEVEQRMLKQAFKAAGAKWSDLNSGDLDSGELESTNSQSPVRAFKGYPR